LFLLFSVFRKLKLTVNKVSSLRDWHVTRLYKSRSDGTLLTVDFNLRLQQACGRYNICDKVSSPILFRKLKLTVNKVSSLRDWHKNVLSEPSFEIFNLRNMGYYFYLIYYFFLF